MTKRPWPYLYGGLLLLAAILTVLFAAIGYLHPTVMDDYSLYTSIAGFHNPVSYAWHGYLTWSGRLTTWLLHWVVLHNGHTRAVLGALNGIIFAGLGWLAAALALGRRPRLLEQDGIVVVFVLAAIWFFAPAIGETVFWRTGADAYLWSLAAGLLFLLPYRRWIAAGAPVARATPSGRWQGAGMLVAGVLIGMNGEQMMILLAVLIPYWLFRYGARPLLRGWPAWTLGGAAGVLVGGVISILGPLNYVRYGYNTPLTVLLFLKQTLAYGARLFHFMLPLLLISIPLILLTRYCGALVPQSRRLTLDWAIAAVASAALLLLLPTFQQDRTLFIPIVMIVIGLASMLDLRRTAFPRLRLVFVTLGVLVAGALLLSGFSVLAKVRQYAGEVAAREQLILQQKRAGQRDAFVPPIFCRAGRYLYIRDIQKDRTFWGNQAVAAYYGIDTIHIRRPRQPWERDSTQPALSQPYRRSVQ